MTSNDDDVRWYRLEADVATPVDQGSVPDDDTFLTVEAAALTDPVLQRLNEILAELGLSFEVGGTPLPGRRSLHVSGGASASEVLTLLYGGLQAFGEEPDDEDDDLARAIASLRPVAPSDD